MNREPQVRSAMFPVVGRQGVALETIHVERLEALDRNERFAVAPGLADVIEILMDSRTADPSASRLDGVSVVATAKGFGGKSYGLALAIADERARAPGSPSTPVVATGRIVERGRGEVGEIEAFAAKAEAVIAFAADHEEGVDFAFPEANWAAAEPTLREQLLQAQRSGRLRLHRCGNVRDAASLWRVARHRPWRAPAVAAAGLLIVFASAAGWRTWRDADVRFCEDRIEALGAAPADSAIAQAVQACRKASEGAPGNGRLHRLYAEALALNSSPALAGTEWRKAAEAGDAEGQAAYGRLLWQSDPADPKKTGLALDWLKRGAAGGSAQAARDVGYILLDGSAFPADPEEARSWLMKARRMEPESPEKEETP